MKFSEKQLTFLSVLFFVLLYGLFYLYKAAKYDLFYYTHDIFSVISTGTGWMRGHPLWWDNRYGLTPALHFSYTAPLLSPFIILFAGKGLFIFHALIYCLVFFIALYSVRDRHTLVLRLAVLIVFLAGPFAFWEFEDIIYGWHIEMTFLPLAIAFSLALISKRKLLIVLFALLLIFTKEDGIVLACCIHLLYLLSANNTGRFNIRKTIGTISIWLAIFIFSLITIKFLREDGSSRLEEALTRLSSNTRFNTIDYFKNVLWQFLIMFFPLASFCFYILGRKPFLKLILLTTPLIITGIVSGLWYFGSVGYSVLWPPRFIAVMSVMIAGTIILIKKEPKLNQEYRPKSLAMTVIIVLILQGFALVKGEDYNLVAQITQAYDNTLFYTVSPADSRIIKSIAEKTPYNYTVAVPYEYFSAFDRNDFVWFDHPENSPQKNPDVIIFQDSSEFQNYNYDYSQYATEKQGRFYVLVKNNLPDAFLAK